MWRSLFLGLSFVLAIASAGYAQNTSPESAQASTSHDASDALPPGYFSEPPGFTAAVNDYGAVVDAFDEDGRRDGFYLEAENAIAGSGMSAGPGYSHAISGNGRVWMSAELSTRLYSAAQARIEFPHLANNHVRIGVQTLYRDSVRVNYFGVGDQTTLSDRTGYRLKTTQLAGYTTWTSGPLALTGNLGWIPMIDVGAMAGRTQSYPDTVRVFSGDAAPGVNADVSYLIGGAEVSFDTRDYPSHPRAGGLVSAGWADYSDRVSGHYSFQRVEASASRYVPLSPRWTLAFREWVVGSLTRADQQVPFYLLPSLGGGHIDRGFVDYRFHDRAMDIFNMESRWALLPHVDAAAFLDAGHVAPAMRDLWKTDTKTSLGAGIILHNMRSTLGRLDVGRSREGWHVMFKVIEAFTRDSSDSGRPTLMPFVP
ncbi:MAG: BamA/TamA family outer membrane protein [Acidobacteriaceae bacterium]|nr:BamA/TamA family outer membrane protein [Acidobacteriaceae bacterium]